VQGRGGFEFAVGFQLDFAGFTQLETGIQGEIVRPEGAGFIIACSSKVSTAPLSSSLCAFSVHCWLRAKP
jgi:hypothetical protein